METRENIGRTVSIKKEVLKLLATVETKGDAQTEIAKLHRDIQNSKGRDKVINIKISTMFFHKALAKLGSQSREDRDRLKNRHPETRERKSFNDSISREQFNTKKHAKSK